MKGKYFVDKARHVRLIISEPLVVQCTRTHADIVVVTENIDGGEIDTFPVIYIEKLFSSIEGATI